MNIISQMKGTLSRQISKSENDQHDKHTNDQCENITDSMRTYLPRPKKREQTKREQKNVAENAKRALRTDTRATTASGASGASGAGATYGDSGASGANGAS